MKQGVRYFKMHSMWGRGRDGWSERKIEIWEENKCERENEREKGREKVRNKESKRERGVEWIEGRG